MEGGLPPLPIYLLGTVLMHRQLHITWWSSGLLCHIVFWLYTNISEEHTASIFRAEERSVKMCMIYIVLEESGHGIGQLEPRNEKE
jgi:hypothetical protein